MTASVDTARLMRVVKKGEVMHDTKLLAGW